MGLSPDLNYYLQGFKLAAAEVFHSDNPIASLIDAFDKMKLPTDAKQKKSVSEMIPDLKDSPTGFRFPYGTIYSLPGIELVSHEPEF